LLFAGAELREGFEVVAATFSKSEGLWTVTSASGQVIKARCLVCADGATSRLATKLGYCTEAPKVGASAAAVPVHLGCRGVVTQVLPHASVGTRRTQGGMRRRPCCTQH
jgi:2-polyprenyl-6-methoxyphenol hydroxylase-like FAD-dependent oxidoreductase